MSPRRLGINHINLQPLFLQASFAACPWCEADESISSPGRSEFRLLHFTCLYSTSQTYFNMNALSCLLSTVLRGRGMKVAYHHLRQTLLDVRNAWKDSAPRETPDGWKHMQSASSTISQGQDAHKLDQDLINAFTTPQVHNILCHPSHDCLSRQTDGITTATPDTHIHKFLAEYSAVFGRGLGDQGYAFCSPSFFCPASGYLAGLMNKKTHRAVATWNSAILRTFASPVDFCPVKN
ncbi:hypothetical protein PAXINDRAFT_17053 [Paxillus involutus ATCC 200175]|uniref:Uncharacterized protein n=1 Tax=Paxillus involutus ATCC 200175 TaxID=664439 RepID=A0A0C9TRQ8_PAXIN|nr:hypothetical protein PAXINDRAFT_17053 [Paxillus involutus ATCC 200175]